MSADDIGGAAGNYAAEEPLLERHEDADDEDEELDVRHVGSEANGWFIWLLTLAAGVSGLLFGYEYVWVIYTPPNLLAFFDCLFFGRNDC